MAVSDFFEVSSIGDVTVTKLLEAAEYRRDRSKEIDLAPLIYRMRGQAPPPLPPPLWMQFRDDLFLFLEETQPSKLVFDFAGLERIGYQPIISTAMNGVYVQARNHSRRFGCIWRLCGFTTYLREFYDAFYFPTLFPYVHDTQSEAVAAFSEPPRPLRPNPDWISDLNTADNVLLHQAGEATVRITDPNVIKRMRLMYTESEWVPYWHTLPGGLGQRQIDICEGDTRLRTFDYIGTLWESETHVYRRMTELSEDDRHWLDSLFS